MVRSGGNSGTLRVWAASAHTSTHTDTDTEADGELEMLESLKISRSIILSATLPTIYEKVKIQNTLLRTWELKMQITEAKQETNRNSRLRLLVRC
jgi:hypothetical protein